MTATKSLVIPATVASAFAKTTGDYHAVFSKEAGSAVATVYVASGATGSHLSALTSDTATASLASGVLHVNLGAKAASRSAAGLAAESVQLVTHQLETHL